MKYISDNFEKSFDYIKRIINSENSKEKGKKKNTIKKRVNNDHLKHL